MLFSALKKDIDLPGHVVLAWDPESVFKIKDTLLECKTIEHFHSICTCKGKGSLQEMIKCFELFCPIVRGNYELLEALAYEFVKQQARNNVVYTEVRYSPHLLDLNGSFTKSDQPIYPEKVIQSVTEGLRRGVQEYHVTVNQILCCICWRSDWADEIVSLAEKYKIDFPCAVVGVDIAAGEAHFDGVKYPELHGPHFAAMQRAQRLGLNITLHAGEETNAQVVKRAVEEYGAMRIGHGYRGVEDADLIKYVKEKNVHFEACPTSSFETGAWIGNSGDWMAHPIKKMFQNQLSVGINSDDPTVFDCTIVDEFVLCHEAMGISIEQFEQSTQAAIGAAFIDEETKFTLRQLLETWKSNNRHYII